MLCSSNTKKNHSEIENTPGFNSDNLNSAYAYESTLNHYVRKKSILKLLLHTPTEFLVHSMWTCFKFLSASTVSFLILLSRTMAIFMHRDRSFFTPAMVMGEINARSRKCHNLTPTIALIVNYACLMAIYWGNSAHGWRCKTLCFN